MAELIVGEFRRTLDDRYRVSVPAELLDPLGLGLGEGLLAKERPGALSLWPVEPWQSQFDAGMQLIRQRIQTGRLNERIADVQLLGRLLSTRQRKVPIAGRGPTSDSRRISRVPWCRSWQRSAAGGSPRSASRSGGRMPGPPSWTRKYHAFASFTTTSAPRLRRRPAAQYSRPVKETCTPPVSVCWEQSQHGWIHVVGLGGEILLHWAFCTKRDGTEAVPPLWLEKVFSRCAEIAAAATASCAIQAHGAQHFMPGLFGSDPHS